MTRKTGAYIFIIAGVIFLVINIYNLDFNNLQDGRFSGIVSNFLLILAMIISVRDIKRKEKLKKS